MKAIKIISPIIPYVAVFIGMYIFKNAWIAVGVYHLGMALILISSGEIVPNRINFPKQKNRAYKPKLISLVLLYLFYSLTGIVLYFNLPFFNHGASLTNKLQMFGLTQANWTLFAVYFCIVNSVLEELFWRGYHESNIASLSNFKYTLPYISKDIFFAGYHVFVLAFFASPIWLLPVFVICFLGSVLWHQIYEITGNIRINIITHFIADVSIVIGVSMRLFR